MIIPHEARLDAAKRLLFVGCGGGFDVFSAIPMAVGHLSAGKHVSFANLSFSDLASMQTRRIGPAGHVIDDRLGRRGYFPELLLRRWLAGKDWPSTVYGLEKTGVLPLKATYDAILDVERPDVVVLVDGGTDSLIKGDEADLGTIAEDALSVVALSMTGHPRISLACLGFGVDLYHGVCHHSFLENTAEAIRLGGYLGCVSVTPGTPDSDLFLDLVAFANAEQPGLRSIVTNSIVGSLEGRFGDYHAFPRTKGSELFINPLMALYWCYDLRVVATMMGFAKTLRSTTTYVEVERAIAIHHDTARSRDWRPLPL